MIVQGKTNTKKTPEIGVILCLLAGVAGVEPALTVLETAVLPLNYTPISAITIILDITDFCKMFFAFLIKKTKGFTLS